MRLISLDRVTYHALATYKVLIMKTLLDPDQYFLPYHHRQQNGSGGSVYLGFKDGLSEQDVLRSTGNYHM